MPLHPQAREFLAQLAANEAPAWHELPPSESRAIFSSFRGIFGEGPKLHAVEDTHIAEVPVRLYRPRLTADAPGILYFHGGGWVLGNVDTHDALCRHLALESDSVVASVDYRLAPEHKYPAAFDDCFAVTDALARRGVEYGIDPTKLVVAGDSAGGNLAAAVSMRARDLAKPALRGQVLIYPVIEPNFETASYRTYATDHGLTRETMQWFWAQYIDGVADDLGYATLAQSNVEDLPRTHVVTAEYDVLCTEGEHYADRLRDGGVALTSKQYPGMLHGFIHFSAMFDDGVIAIREIANEVKQMVA